MDDDFVNRRNRFLRKACRDVQSFAEVMPPQSASFKYLEERLSDPIYFAAEVAKERRKEVLLRFESFFKCNEHVEMLRPNEVDIQDSFHYFKKILSWLGEAVMTEAAIVNQLLWPNLMQYNEITYFWDPETLMASFHDPDILRMDVLNSIFEAFCAPVQELGESTLKSQLDLTSSYELCIVFETFNSNVPDLFGVCALGSILKTLQDKAEKMFLCHLDEHREKLLECPLSDPVDLSAIPAVKDGVRVLLEIIKIHDNADLSVDVPPYKLVISYLLAPALQICDKAMMAHKSNVAQRQLHKSPVDAPSPSFISRPVFQDRIKFSVAALVASGVAPPAVPVEEKKEEAEEESDGDIGFSIFDD